MGNTQFTSELLSEQNIRRRDFLITKRGQEWLNNKWTQGRIHRLYEDLQIGAAKREQEEFDSTRGERVWFSRYIWNGALMHWALIVHGTKYEFRRVMINNSVCPEFTCNISPWSIDQEQEQAVRMNLPQPVTDGYCVCLIGWTNLSRDDYYQTWQSFQGYTSSRREGQDFLRLFTKQILALKATDYKWFEKNFQKKYISDDHLVQASLRTMMRMSQRQPFGLADAGPEKRRQPTQEYIEGQNRIRIQLENQVVLYRLSMEERNDGSKAYWLHQRSHIRRHQQKYGGMARLGTTTLYGGTDSNYLRLPEY